MIRSGYFAALAMAGHTAAVLRKRGGTLMDRYKRSVMASSLLEGRPGLRFGIH